MLAQQVKKQRVEYTGFPSTVRHGSSTEVARWRLPKYCAHSSKDEATELLAEDQGLTLMLLDKPVKKWLQLSDCHTMERTHV